MMMGMAMWVLTLGTPRVKGSDWHSVAETLLRGTNQSYRPYWDFPNGYDPRVVLGHPYPGKNDDALIFVGDGSPGPSGSLVAAAIIENVRIDDFVGDPNFFPCIELTAVSVFLHPVSGELLGKGSATKEGTMGPTPTSMTEYSKPGVHLFGPYFTSWGPQNQRVVAAYRQVLSLALGKQATVWGGPLHDCSGHQCSNCFYFDDSAETVVHGGYGPAGDILGGYSHCGCEVCSSPKNPRPRVVAK